MAVFLAIAPFILNGINRLFYPSRILITYTTSVAGRVTGSYVNRQHHLFYLDGNTGSYYDFNAFVPATAAPQSDTLSQDQVNALVLGAYLQIGDRVTKPANSTSLSIQRGDSITQWKCPRELI